MPAPAETTLAYAVRWTAICRYLGHLCLALVGIALIPAAFALLTGKLPFAWRAGTVAATLAALGFLMSRVGRPRELMMNEAMVIIAVGYLATAAFMSWPLMAEGLAPLDAMFHAMSAVTTTGLSTLASVGEHSSSLWFTQAWMQWYGGLVIVVLAVFLVGPGPAAKRLSANEMDHRDVLGGTRSRAVRTLVIYGGMTVIGVLLLRLLGADWPDAFLHALTAISTGGFSSHDDSLLGVGGFPVQAGATVLGLTGAVSWTVYYNLLRRASGATAAWNRDLLRGQVGALLVACLVVSILLASTMSLFQGMPLAEVLRQAPLLAASAQTTTGFSTMPVASLDDGSKLILTIAMLIGGDFGSTAGGIKIFRLLVVMRLLQLALLRTALPPHAVPRPSLAHGPLEERDTEEATAMVALYVVVVLISWFAFLLHGYPAADSLFEVVSATATAGLSIGLSNPELEPVLKGVLLVDMWMGRLEILAVLILFHPRTWFGRRAETP